MQALYPLNSAAKQISVFCLFFLLQSLSDKKPGDSPGLAQAGRAGRQRKDRSVHEGQQRLYPVKVGRILEGERGQPRQVRPEGYRAVYV